MEKILVSACLLGQKTRYDGKDAEKVYLKDLNRYYDLVPFCPEVEGGLPTPRLPAMLYGETVKNEAGKDVTKLFYRGAEKALALCNLLGIQIAILKERSPSCGTHEVHDGRRGGKLKAGEGITARMLKMHGITVMNEDEGERFLQKEVERRRIKAQKKANLKAKEEEAKASEKKASPSDKKPLGKRKPFAKRANGRNEKPAGKGKFEKRKPAASATKSAKPSRSYKKPSSKPGEKKPYGTAKKKPYSSAPKKPYSPSKKTSSSKGVKRPTNRRPR